MSKEKEKFFVKLKFIRETSRFNLFFFFTSLKSRVINFLINPPDSKIDLSLVYVHEKPDIKRLFNNAIGACTFRIFNDTRIESGIDQTCQLLQIDASSLTKAQFPSTDLKIIDL